MPTSGTVSAGTVSETEFSDSSHGDIDESIQHWTSRKNVRLGLFVAYVSNKTAVSNMSMSTHSVDWYWTTLSLTLGRTWRLVGYKRNCISQETVEYGTIQPGIFTDECVT